MASEKEKIKHKKSDLGRKDKICVYVCVYKERDHGKQIDKGGNITKKGKREELEDDYDNEEEEKVKVKEVEERCDQGNGEEWKEKAEGANQYIPSHNIG